MKRFEQTTAWHSLELTRVFEFVRGSQTGLAEIEAVARLESVGRNQLPSRPPPTLGVVLLRQLRNPLIYILGIAAAISLLLQEYTDAGFIAGVVLVNTLIGGFQEWKAEQGARALQQLLEIHATVLRDHVSRQISAELLVPGDVVILESGNRVPADIRLLTSNGLQVDESLLTGESLAVAKDPSWIGEPNAPVGDRKNMAHGGSIVTRGRATGIVVETGASTLVGRLALDVIASHGGKPPLVIRMERFTRVVAGVVLGASVIVGAIGVLGRGFGLHEMFFFAVALAVSAIPEGLPVAMTVALAIATSRMARRNVIVRRLAAVEGLGSCTLIASDKTGTLTCNELTVRQIRLADGSTFQVTGEGFVPSGQILGKGMPLGLGASSELDEFMRAVTLCNEGDLHAKDGTWVWRGDPTDIALLSAARKMGHTREAHLLELPMRQQIPFEPEHRFAATYHRDTQGARIYVKGAPERVLRMCDSPRTSWQQAAEEMAGEGFRVLTVATKIMSEMLPKDEIPPTPSGLKFLGFVGMIDPLRAGAKQAVAKCRDAGIQVCMITGDHPVTALAIARDLGFAESLDQVTTGSQLEGKDPSALKDLVERIRVFARVAPWQKLQLVEAAQAAGKFVAVTGDGVNDAPALRKANIGVAMGRSGTDVALEAAELVIADDNFASLVAGVEEGRVAYDNIRKVIYLLISTGSAEVILAGLAIAFGLPIPLLPVQLLWLNLVTNGIQDVALAFEPNEGDVMKRSPRPPRERIFNQLMIERTVIAGLVMGGVAFASFEWMLRTGMNESSARNLLLILMVLFENVHIGNCRSEVKSAFVLSPLKSPILLSGTIVAFLVHVAAIYTPWGQAILRTEPVELEAWPMLFALALTVFVAMELHKWTWRRRHRKPRSYHV